MWGWGWSNGRRGGSGGMSWWPLVGIGLFLLFVTGAWRWGWWVWPVLFFVVIPFVRNLMRGGSNGSQQGERRTPWERDDEAAYEKPKRGQPRAYTAYGNDEDDEIGEKPKHRPQYAVGDDGELVELTPDTELEREVPDDSEETPPARRQNDDYDYV